MNTGHYEQFVTRQTERVDRSREVARYRRRLRWWARTAVAAMIVFAVVIIIGELV